jgi:hypothetical protein
VIDSHTDAVLEQAAVRWPPDDLAADPKLHCDRCDTDLCDVEEGDTLSILVRMALSHYDTCDPNRDSADTDETADETTDGI